MREKNLQQWYARPWDFQNVWCIEPAAVGECQTDCLTVYLTDDEVARIRKHEDEDTAIQRLIEDKIIKVWGIE